jgi:hypothetical protein
MVDAFENYRRVYNRKLEEFERKALIHRLAGKSSDPKYDPMTTAELRGRVCLKYYAGVETEDEMWATPTCAEPEP